MRVQAPSQSTSLRARPASLPEPGDPSHSLHFLTFTEIIKSLVTTGYADVSRRPLGFGVRLGEGGGTNAAPSDI